MGQGLRRGGGIQPPVYTASTPSRTCRPATTADHLIILTLQVSPFRWHAAGVFERDGRVVGVIGSGGECRVESLYPPAGYIVPPPPGALAGLTPARRSGVPVIDAVLNAAQTGNVTAMARLISYGEVGCRTTEYTPPCPPAAEPGTMVEAVPVTHCHGGYETRDDAPAALVNIFASSSLYSIPEPSPGSTRPPLSMPDSPKWSAVFIYQERSFMVASFDEEGVVSVHHGCGVHNPELMTGGTPNFLLPPP